MSFRLLPAARTDISSIASQIAKDNPQAALRWVDKLLICCRKLGEFPDMGSHRSDIREGLRMFPFGKYLVLFRRDGQGVEIVRVVHGARRWQRLLKGPRES